MTQLHPQAALFSKAQGYIDLETIPRDKMFQIYGLEAAIGCLRTAIPGGVHCMEILGILCQNTIHSYPGLANTSTDILRDIVTRRPSFRSSVAHAFSRFARFVPDTEPQLMSKNAENILQLLRIWFHQLEGGSYERESRFDFEVQPETPEVNFAQLDALGILYMCSPLVHTRQSGSEILKTATALHAFYEGMGDLTPSIYPLLLRKAPVIIRRSFIAPGVVASAEFTTKPPLLVPNLDQILLSLEKEKQGRCNVLQSRWSRILAGIADLASEECMETAKELWKCIKERVIPVQHTMESLRAENSPLFEEQLTLWSNYIHVAVGCSAVNDTSIFETAGGEQTIQSARELFREIIPALKSNHFLITSEAQDAISFLPPMAVDSFVTELGNYNRSAFDEEKGKRALKQQNAIMLSYAYRVISVNRMPGYLYAVKGNLTHHLSYLEHQLDRVPEIASTTDNVIEIMYWRYNLCLYIVHIYRDIVKEHGPRCRSELDSSLFQSTFSFLLTCSGYPDNGNSLNEVQKTKDRKQFLASYKARTEQDDTSLAESSPEIFERQAISVQEAAGQAIAALCFGANEADEEDRKFHWISNVFQADQEVVSGQVALKVAHLVGTDEAVCSGGFGQHLEE